MTDSHEPRYTFHTGHVPDEIGKVYTIGILRYPDGGQHCEQLELMRMAGDEGRDYLADAAPKFERMLADVGIARTERAARTWGRLHGADIQPWREIDAQILHPPDLDID